VTRFVRSDDWRVREVGGRHVLVPLAAPVPADVVMYVLDGDVAAALWEALAAPRTAAELVELVLATFEGADRSAVEADVGAFLGQLTRLGAGCMVPTA
jgi:hypothetical protein